MSEMQTAPWPREGRIKASKTATRARAVHGENPLLTYIHHGDETGSGCYLLFEFHCEH